MKPGKELDALILKYIFGAEVEWREVHVADYSTSPSGFYGKFPERTWCYHTGKFGFSILNSWEIVDEMSKKGFTYTITNGRDDGLIGCAFLKDIDLLSPHGSAAEKTVSLAVCVAALRACGVEVTVS